jgi:hypothetical protein
VNHHFDARSSDGAAEEILGDTVAVELRFGMPDRILE